MYSLDVPPEVVHSTEQSSTCCVSTHQILFLEVLVFDVSM
jgi:hypothetical protein